VTFPVLNGLPSFVTSRYDVQASNVTPTVIWLLPRTILSSTVSPTLVDSRIVREVFERLHVTAVDGDDHGAWLVPPCTE
jgi:hypothetical protein